MFAILGILSGFLKPFFSWLGAKIFQKKLEEMKAKADFERALKEQSAATGYQSQATSENLRENSEVSEQQKLVNAAKLSDMEKL